MPKPTTDDRRHAVLITGAAKRIGRAVARKFADAGWDVAIHYLGSEDQAASLATEIRELGSRVVTVECDLRDPAAVKSLVPRCNEELGSLDCLVNNASAFRFDEATDLDEDSWDLHLDVNLKTPMFLAQAFAKQLPDGKNGNIINIIDQRVLKISPDFFSYSISKAALWTATRMLAQALAPKIRVNAIGPGPTLASIHQTETDFAQEAASTLLGHGTTPEEIARTIQFLLNAPAMTGQMIVLDGGQHLDWSDTTTPASKLQKTDDPSAAGQNE